MVDMKTETKPHQDQKPVNPRTAIRDARQRRLRLVSQGKAATVKVFAANETFRETLRHANGRRFRDTIDQAVEWPNDSFTSRRIAEGSVRTDGPGSGEMAEPDESLNPRQQAAANKPKESKQEHEPARNGGSKPARSQHQPEPPEPPQPAA
jgi:hypothetical protein